MRATGLGPDPDPAFVRHADLVRRCLKIPAARVTLVSEDRQLHPGVSGQNIPPSWSLCRHVVESGTALILADASARAADPAIGAYAGMPLVDAEGQVLGALEAVDTVPRTWSEEDQAALQDLAATCSAELQLRIQISRTRTALAETESARQ
ncbi:MAG: GAF domain-containing protein, partial [Candidatus Limnocylindrales bacterium]